MKRRLAREAAFSLFYEAAVLGDMHKDTLAEMQDILKTEALNEENHAYIEKVTEIYEEKQQTIDAAIAPFCRAWKIERLSKVDLSILRLALIELSEIEEIPYKVVINEAVELAKKYGSDKSPAFIHGVLGAYLRENKIR